MTDQYNDDLLNDDVKRYLELKAKADELTSEMDDIKARIRGHCPLGKTPTDCGVDVTISPNRRFNADLARAVLPPALLELCMETVVDSRKAKANLPPAVYASCMKETGDPIVKIG